MQASTLLQTDNHTSTPPLSFLQAGCPSCRPTNSVKALKEKTQLVYLTNKCESIKGNLLLPVIQTLSFSLSPKILTKSNVVKDTFAGSEA